MKWILVLSILMPILTYFLQEDRIKYIDREREEKCSEIQSKINSANQEKDAQERQFQVKLCEIDALVVRFTKERDALKPKLASLETERNLYKNGMEEAKNRLKQLEEERKKLRNLR